ncbi:MAG TPA: hypothetical protein VK509_07800 [Polyangiales bacterium]|nr:hypothetical protein [Polyangiales bacterium]
MFGLANELSARGLEVELQDTDVEAAPAALAPTLRCASSAFEPPYPAFDETLDGSAARREETRSALTAAPAGVRSGIGVVRRTRQDSNLRPSA